MKQENRPPRILYWKWDDSHIDSGSYRAGIDDLCERSCFDTVFICTHWCRDGLSTKKTHDAVLDACRLLHARGKKLILEIDARSEKERFCTAYPEARTGIVYWKELPADAEHADFRSGRPAVRICLPVTGNPVSCSCVSTVTAERSRATSPGRCVN